MRVSKSLLLILAVILMLVPSLLFAADKVILSNGEWAPYLGKNLKNGGPTSDAVAQAFKAVGVEVEYKWYGESWKRAYHDALAGKKVQGTLVWSKKPEREKEMHYSEGMLIPGQKTVFFHLKDKAFDWKTIDDLKGLKIGGRLGYTYGEDFDNAAKDGVFRLEEADKEIVNFKKLLAGRLDLVVVSEDIGNELLKKEMPADKSALITYHDTPVRVTGYHLLLTKALPENEALMKKFDEGLKKLMADGTFDKIMTAK
ncbi:MAG: transporter substrate-binding domain-containing protein [Desulfobacterales bacterium]|nr:transporter substrate-binding domain-containing protein [Desulfobacterales bacterium]